MIVYCLPFTSRCGGVKIVGEHVSRLAASGHKAEWWGLESSPTWFGPVAYRQFPNTNELGAAMRALPIGSVKVATFVTTWEWVGTCLNPGDKGFGLLQDFDGTTYLGSEAHDRRAFSYGLKPIVESEWVERVAKEKFGLDPVNVGIGIDFSVFYPEKIERDRNRIFTSYRPGAGPNDLKGWGLALQVARLVCRENPQASLVTFGSHGQPNVQGIPHINVNSPSDAKLRELYSQAGCFLLSSRHEGFGLTAAEAMACACPVVCTNANGNMEFCLHNETAAVGDTAENLARKVLYFQRNPNVADRFGQAGYELVTSRYQWDGVIDHLARLLSCDES